MSRRSGAEEDGGPDRHLADGSGAPDRHRVGRLDVALHGRLPAGREDVGEEKQLLVRDAVRHLDVGGVGERNAQILGLAAGIAAGEVGVAEQARRRVAEGGGRDLLVAVGGLADGEVAPFALVALAADDGEGDHHPVADLQLVTRLRPDLDDLPHGFVAHNVAALHAGHEVVVEVQVGAADGAARDLDDGVPRLLDHRIGHLVAADVRGAMPDQSLHRRPS
jgi:hypothetical protein